MNSSIRPGPSTSSTTDSTGHPDHVRLLDAATPDEGATLTRLGARLVAEADRDGVLDVAYRTLDTAVGALLLAATGQGLLRVAFPSQDHDAVLVALGRAVSPRILHAPARLDEVCRQLDGYFAGRRTAFELPLDLRLSTGFRRGVLAHLAEIGYGRTESYKQVAEAAGSPRAFRAVGTACATNPLPVVLPCHRVLPSTGSIGRYAGGADAKLALLRLEGAA